MKNIEKRKKIICGLLLLFIFITEICGYQAFRQNKKKENCYLCGSNSQSLVGIHRGKDEIGIICVNNWYIVDFNFSAPVQESGYEAGIDVTHTNLGEENCSFVVRSDSENGNVDAEIVPGKEKQLDQKRMEKRFCKECQEKIQKVTDIEEKQDLILIDFQTMKLYPLKEEQTIRNYEISTETQSDSGKEKIVIKIRDLTAQSRQAA